MNKKFNPTSNISETEFAKKISAVGGTVYLVGGAVRDMIRGVQSKDRDYCVEGITEKIFVENFPRANKIGKKFPVYLINIDNRQCEVAFTRTETKSELGHRGFNVKYSADIKIEQDLYRRDTTMNAMAINILTGEIIDPFGGREDIADKKIRAVSEHFIEDPVRALRAARQSAQFNFEICSETLLLMKKCAMELMLEPGERIFSELKSALETDKPSIFFRNLDKADLLEVTFPEIAALKGKIQPVEFHPEGDAYEHTMKILDDVAAVNKKPEVRFAALTHDLGKGTTPLEMLPHHYQHEKRGVNVLMSMYDRLNFPKHWRIFAEFVIAEHMRAPRLKVTKKIVELLIKINYKKFPIKDFNDIIRADCGGTLPFYLEHADFIIEELLKIRGNDAPAELKGSEISAWILEKRCMYFGELKDKFE